LNLPMACEACGNGPGDGTGCPCSETMGVSARPRLTASNLRRHVSRTRPRQDVAVRTLPAVRSLLPVQEIPVGTQRPSTRVRPVGTPVGERPVGPVVFGPSGLPRPTEWVPVWETRRRSFRSSSGFALVDGTGRLFCSSASASCQRPFGHLGRCGPWAICGDCGEDYGSRHKDTCSNRPAGVETDKPPGVCDKVAFCELPSGHKGVHARADWRSINANVVTGFAPPGPSWPNPGFGRYGPGSTPPLPPGA
jgi:hypothetical protein